MSTALGIVALVLSLIGIALPSGVLIGILSSVIAVFSYRHARGLSGAAFILNILNAAIFSPSLVVASAVDGGEAMGTYLTILGGLFMFAIVFNLLMGKPKSAVANAEDRLPTTDRRYS